MNIAQELTTSAAVLQRRSVKSFKPEAIPEETLQKIIDLTLEAPSSWNFQPTRLVVLKSDAQKEALAKVAWNQKQITQAAVTFVYAVSIRGWEQTMDQVIETATTKGAWPEKFGEFIRGNAPSFQDGLGEKEREFAMKDAMICATTTALVAESFGYGSCFMNGWQEEGVKEVIGVADDPDVGIALVLPVGVPDVIPENPGRLPQSETVFVDRLG